MESGQVNYLMHLMQLNIDDAKSRSPRRHVDGIGLPQLNLTLYTVESHVIRASN